MTRKTNRFYQPRKGNHHCPFCIAIWMVMMILLLPACGKKGPPVPSTFVEPPVVNGLQVLIEKDTATLVWRVPAWKEKKEDSLAGFYVYQSQIPFSEKACDDCPVRYIKVADIQIQNNASTGSYTMQLEAGFQYSFRVSVYTDNGYEGEKSETVAIEF